MTHLSFKQSDLPGEWASDQFVAFCDRLIKLADDLDASKIVISPMLSTVISMDDRFQRSPQDQAVNDALTTMLQNMPEEQKMRMLSVMLEESKAAPAGDYPTKFFGTLAGFPVYLDPMLGEDAPAMLYKNGAVVGSIALTEISYL